MVDLYSVPSNIYKLDGGAMFGNAPKPLWQRWMPPDEQNRIRMATRPLLAVTGNAVILFEAGIGAYMEPKLKERFGVDFAVGEQYSFRRNWSDGSAGC